MDVARIGRTVGAYKAFTPKSAEKHVKSEVAKDIFSLSGAAKDFQTIKNALGSVSETRTELVEAYREKMRSGAYKADENAIAEKIVSAGWL